MDFLQRLDHLMRIKGVSKAEMAAGAGIGKTTVYAWWDKGYEGITLPKLRKLCNYFGCTLDWLCGDDEENDGMAVLTAEETQLLTAWHNADERAQADALNTLLAHPRAETQKNRA
ncbi:MAG: helix-turn-helix transcriptional regulator [Oscillospiraceae bacterium]|nr:helix-turn-helix transcriptional regulator [Oscillospiraceae bacterium]